MANIILKGRRVSGGVAEGEALVSKQTVGFYGGLDPNTGMVIEKGHELEGQRVTGRVLVFPRGKGSTAAPYILYASIRRGSGPVAIINVEADAIVAVAAVMSNIPLVDKLEQNPLEVINSGDWVQVDADKGVVEVTRGEPKT